MGKCRLKDHRSRALTSVLHQMELLLEGVAVISESASVGRVGTERVGG